MKIYLKEEKLIKIAQKLGQELIKDKNNIALTIFGSVATNKIIKHPDLDLLLITRKAPVQTEPKNVEERIINNENVEISRISSERLKEDIENLLDYRIVQIQQAVVIFDKANVISDCQEVVKILEPDKKILQKWLNELKNDKIFLRSLKNLTIFKFLSNRIALWSLRIYLTLKKDYFQGTKHLFGQLKRHPEIEKQFREAFALDSINLKIISEFKKIIPFQENSLLRCAFSRLTDVEELKSIGDIYSAKVTLIEALAFYGLYLQETENYSSWKELLKKEDCFRRLVSKCFNYKNSENVFENNLKFIDWIEKQIIHFKSS